jgi:hypothetical protein
MFTEDQTMRALRILLNRGTVTTLEVSQKSDIDLSIVEEIMASALTVNYIVKYNEPPSYLLNSTGILAIELYSLKKLVEFLGGVDDTF